MPQPPLILASRSPRRAALLRQAGYRFTVAAPPFNDPPQPTDEPIADPGRLAAELAMLKAKSLAESLAEQVDPSAVILAADTLVAVGQTNVTDKDAPRRWRLLGQPQSRADANVMLRRLMNADHHVLTGVALCSTPDRTESFVDLACVHLGHVGDEALERYLDSGAWRGKAGGYNLLELQRDWPFRVDGDPTTVAGLPMMKLVQRLREWSILPQVQPNVAAGASRS